MGKYIKTLLLLALWDRTYSQVYVFSATDTIPPLVWVAGGTFSMGCDEGGYADEIPVHTRSVPSFYMGQYEVTNAAFVVFLNASRPLFQPDSRGNTFRADGHNAFYLFGAFSTAPQHIVRQSDGFFSVVPGFERHPVVRVSWYTAQGYCAWLRRKTGRPFRLPSEAEWEYAARGGQKARGMVYAGSNSIDSVAWYWDNAGRVPHAVGQKQPNELGLYDLSGNAWEWCQDKETAYPDGPPPRVAGGQRRVARGGSWNYEAWNCRVTDRYFSDPDEMRHVTGLRVVADGTLE